MQKKQQQKVEEEMWVNKNVRKHVSEKLIPQDRKTFLEHLKYKGCVCVCVKYLGDWGERGWSWKWGGGIQGSAGSREEMRSLLDVGSKHKKNSTSIKSSAWLVWVAGGNLPSTVSKIPWIKKSWELSRQDSRTSLCSCWRCCSHELKAVSIYSNSN